MNNVSNEKEYAIQFRCQDDLLTGIIHRPKNLQPNAKAVIIVVAGGPQYRVGAHRQFVQLARVLSKEGIAVLRFDLRGMGDSEGTHRGYEESEPDIKAAIDALFHHEKRVSEVSLFGECESASGIIFYAYTDNRINGLILVNPWVRTEEGQARTYIKHYYLNRFVSAEFWLKIVSGKYNIVESMSSFIENAIKTLKPTIDHTNSSDEKLDRESFRLLPLPIRTVKGLQLFKGPALFLISGNDYIAREFDEVISMTDEWKNIFEESRISRYDIADADHTFSKKEWKNDVRMKIIGWLKQR